MPMSAYLSNIRSLVGNQLLTLPSVTGIIRNADGDILLVRNTGESQWATPGGMIEPLEGPAISVVREMKEELNIDVQPIKLLGVFSGPEYTINYPNGDAVVYVTTVFACEVVRGAPTPDFDELEACQFFNKTQIAELETPAWLDNLLANVDAGSQYN